MSFFNKVVVFFIMAIVLGLSACHSSSQDAKKTSENWVSVEKKSPKMSFYFRGVIEPIQVFSVISPFEGRLTQLNFNYGDTLKQGDIVAAMSSLTLSEDFKKVVTDFLTKKSAYYNAKEDYTGVKMLYEAGVSSKSDFLSSESSFQNDALAYMQSQFELETLLHKLNIDPKDIEKLSLADQDKLAPLLARQFKHIEIPATGSGVALFPIKESNNNGSDEISGELHVGSKLNEGQLMLSIGDMSGLSIDVVASEESINRLHQGMSAIITSDAFPGIRLKGKVKSVSLQADPNTSGGQSLSQFPLHVIVPKVEAKAASRIKVGMTCKVQLDVESPPALMLPLNAVKFDGHVATVDVRMKSGEVKTVKVLTGVTTLTDVVIISGLKEGDQVVVHDSRKATLKGNRMVVVHD